MKKMVILIMLFLYFFYPIISDFYLPESPVHVSCEFPDKIFAAVEIPHELKHYYAIQDMYRKWQEGLFGSRRYHETMLREYLTELIRKNIMTDNDYTIVLPEGIINKKVKCNFDSCRWLNFHGKVDITGVKDVVESDPELLKKWWRSKMLVSVSGKIRKYRFGRDHNGDTIELFLYKINVKIAPKAKK